MPRTLTKRFKDKVATDCLADCLIRLRAKRGMSQRDLAKKTGLSRCYISRIESGGTEPSVLTLMRYCAGCDCLLRHLITTFDYHLSRIKYELEKEVL